MHAIEHAGGEDEERECDGPHSTDVDAGERVRRSGDSASATLTEGLASLNGSGTRSPDLSRKSRWLRAIVRAIVRTQSKLALSRHSHKHCFSTPPRGPTGWKIAAGREDEHVGQPDQRSGGDQLSAVGRAMAQQLAAEQEERADAGRADEGD